MSSGNIYVGVDLHKRSFTYVMVDDAGAILKRGSCATDLGAISDFAVSLSERHQVVLEPLENSFWFIGCIKRYVGSVHLANPYRTRLIAESRLKNDRIDAQILADLLRVGYLPEVYIPSDQIIGWRRLVYHRIRLGRDRARLKSRILSVLNREGFKIKYSDPFGRRGRQELDRLPLSSGTRRIVDDNIVHLDLLSSQLAELDREIASLAKSDEIMGLLCTIDGIGPLTALAIRAAVGDISRFRNARAFAAYTGLIPSCRQSAETVRNGPITKQGINVLRSLLIQAVPHAVRHSDYLKRLYYRINLRSSVNKARVAVAHALARMIYHVWMEARPYYR